MKGNTKNIIRNLLIIVAILASLFIIVCLIFKFMSKNNIEGFDMPANLLNTDVYISYTVPDTYGTEGGKVLYLKISDILSCGTTPGPKGKDDPNDCKKSVIRFVDDKSNADKFKINKHSNGQFSISSGDKFIRYKNGYPPLCSGSETNTDIGFDITQPGGKKYYLSVTQKDADGKQTTYYVSRCHQYICNLPGGKKTLRLCLHKNRKIALGFDIAPV